MLYIHCDIDRMCGECMKEQRKTGNARPDEKAGGHDGGEVTHSSDGSEKMSVQESTLFGKQFSEKEQKSLFLYLVVGIVLMELAVTVGAILFSITNAQKSSTGIPEFHFPWIGYLVSVVLVPVLVMLLVNLVSLGFSRPSSGASGGGTEEAIPQRMRTFYALIRGAPTVILFAGFVLMGAAIYYFDGVIAFLLKLGDAFEVVAIWVVGGFTAAWIISYVVRMWLQYKSRQMEAEYAFRQEVLRRTGMVILDTKHAPTTEFRMLPAPDMAALPPVPDLEPHEDSEDGSPLSEPADDNSFATDSDGEASEPEKAVKSGGQTPEH